MENTKCLSPKLEAASEGFQLLKSWYPGKSDKYLVDALVLYRKDKRLDDDWYPESVVDHRKFTFFLNNRIEAARQRNTESDTTEQDVEDIYTDMLRNFTPTQLDNRVSLLARNFHNTIESERKNAFQERGVRLSTFDIVERAGGYAAVMHEIFNVYKNYTEEDILTGELKYSDAESDATKKAKRAIAKKRYDAYQKMYLFRERLSALAAGLIGENEGLMVGYNGLEVNLKKFEEQELRSLNDEFGQTDPDDIPDDEGTKGDRYVDVRTLKLYNTLSVRAKSLLARIPKVDSSGEVARDDLGHISYIDGRQVAYTLLNVLQDASPDNMMATLTDAKDVYPWLGGLVKILEKNPDERATVWANFKKSPTTYAYVAYEDGGYTTKLANTRAQGYSLMRDAGNNMRSGYVMEETTSVYDENGNISFDVKEKERLVSESLKDISQIDGISVVGNEAKPRNPKNKYEEIGGVDGIAEFLKDHPRFAESVAIAARGIGFNISAAEVENAAKQTISEKSFRFMSDTKAKKGRNKLSVIVSNIVSVYDRATEVLGEKEATAERLYDTSASELQHINSALALSLYDELEPRTLENGKTLSTYNNINLLHQVMADLSNRAGASEESYQQYLNDEYLQYEGFTTADGKPVGWLKALMEDTTGNGMRKKFRVLDMTHFNHVEYAKLSPAQKLTATFMMWARSVNESNYSAYEVPIQADYENAWNFIQSPTYSTDSLVNMLADEVLIEYDRIKAIEERDAFDHNGENNQRDYLSVYEEQGRKFQIFPEFNGNNFRKNYEAFGEGESAKRDKFVHDQVREQLSKIVQKDFQTITESGMLTNPILKNVYSPNWKKANNFYAEDGRVESLDEKAQKFLESWAANTFFARLQMTKLFTGDLAQFNGLLDYEKRNMLLHAPRTSLYTEATWNGEKVLKRDYQNVVYLEDEQSRSAFYGQISEMLDALERTKKISPSQRDRMKKAYEKIKSTDGQGFRTLDSYRAVRIAENEWDDEHEQAYRKIKDKNASQRDIEVFVRDVYMQNTKPVATGFEYVEAAPLPGQKPVKATFLHKYSETVLLPMELIDSAFSLQSAPIGGMSLAAQALSGDVDMFLFHSNVKVGAHAVVDPFGFAKDKKTGKLILDENGNPIRKTKTKEEVKDYIVGSVKRDKFAIHKIPWKYYGIAASTPAHGEDDAISWSSQAEKEVWGNIEENDTLAVNGEEMKSTDARTLYDSIVAASIAEAYQTLSAEIADPDRLEKILQEELASKSYSSPELSYALRRLKTGDFALPMYMPSIQRGVEQILLSVIKKRLTRPKTKGANMLQVTSLGMDTDPFNVGMDVPKSHKLGIEFEGSGDNMRVKWIDCYISIHDSGLEEFADENGAITPERLQQLIDDKIIPEDALQFVAYRTPSDDMHSVLPLRIKGFLPKTCGANIMVSKEAMVMTGHDYDGDKLRCHFQSFHVKHSGTWDEELLHKDYERAVKNQDKEIAKYILNTDKNANAPDTQEYSYEFFRKRMLSKDNPDREKYRIKESRVVMDAYDYSKSPLENSQTARDSARVQLIFANLTSVAGSQRMLIPGGCDETKIYAKSIHILQAAHNNNDVKKVLRDNGIDVTSDVSIYNDLVKKEDKFLSGILDAINDNETPLSLTHSLDAFEYMMGGAEMIGIYALYNSAAQMMQKLGLRYIPNVDSKGRARDIEVFGKRIDHLFEIRGKDGRLSSLALSRFLNAAVDNGKDPILGYVNQTPELSDITNFLLASGLGEEEVHMIINQPAIVELSKRLSARTSQGFQKETDKLIDEILDKAHELTRFYVSDKGYFMNWYALDQVQKKGRDEYVEHMAVDYNEVLNSNDHGHADFQLAILGMLREIHGAASDLSEFIRCTRPEATSGGLGTSVSQTIVNVNKLDSLRNRCLLPLDNPKHVRINGIWDIIKPREIGEGSSEKSIMDSLGDKMQQVVALNSLMMDTTLESISRYFPQALEGWKEFSLWIAGKYSYINPQENIIRRVGEEMILWRLLQDKNFIGDVEETRKDIVINMPKRLRDLKIRIDRARKEWERNHTVSDRAAAALVDNVFLKKLEVYTPQDENERPRLRFMAGGPVVEGMTDRIRFDWANLMTNPDESVRKLATDLYLYNLFTNGFGFGMYEFAHFAPYNVIKNVPGYLDALRKVGRTTFDYESEEAQRFLDQYYQNHWGDEKLVPQLTAEEYKNASPELNEKIAAHPYIVIVTKGEKGRKNTNFYKVVPTNNDRGFTLQKAEKLGAKNKYGQTFVQYNPDLEAKDMKPITAGVDSAWGPFNGNNLNAWAQGNISAPGSRANDDAARADSLAGQKEQTTNLVPDRDTAMRKFLMVDDDGSKQEFDRKAEIAAAQSDNPLAKMKPSATTPPMVESGNAFGQPSFNEMSREQIASLPGFRGFTSEEEEGQTNSMPDGKMFSIAERVVDENGKQKVEIRKLASTPETIRLARKQKTYVELNKKLRDILRRNNVGIGVLDHAEQMLGANGVTDFDTANVTAEGLLEMIRIAEGYSGEYALPEEFSHVALEMLGHNHPLVQRLLNAIDGNEEAMQEAYNGMYDEYVRLYGNQHDKLVLEAAGKLVGKHLLRQQEIQTSFIRRLVARVSDAIKSVLRRFSKDEIQNAIFDANQVASQIAREMLGGKLLDVMSLDNVHASGQYYEATQDITDRQDILTKLLKNLLKRRDLLVRRANGRTDEKNPVLDKVNAQIAELDKAIKSHKTESAILTYMNDSLDYLAKLEKSLDETLEKNAGKANLVCTRLNSIRDTLYGYSKIIQDVREAIVSNEVQNTQALTSIIDEVDGAVERFFRKYNTIAMTYFEQMLSSVYGEHGKTITTGRNKGKVVSIKEMARIADNDISLMSRWFNSLADCGDLVLSAIDDIVRKAKMRSRDRLRLVKPRIETAIADLERETGSRDQSFMFEMKRWNLEEDGIEDDGKLHKTGKYIAKNSDAYRKLSAPQKKFYDKMMEIKAEIDQCVPDSMLTPDGIVMLRKYTIDRAKSADGVKNKSIELWEGIRNSVLDTSDSIDFENYEVVVDFQGSRVDKLPLLYLRKGRKESYDDMTDDVATSMLAYAGMGFEYNEMNSIVAILENAKYMAANRDVIQHTGQKLQRESIGTDKDALFYYNQPFSIKQINTNLQRVLDDFYQMHVYGHVQKNEGTFQIGGINTKVSKRKAVNMANRIASYSQMAINLQQRIANITTGFSQVIIESAAGGSFNIKDVSWATKEYIKNTGDRLMDTGRTESDNYLSLWREYFDVGQENGRNNQKYGKGWFARTFNTSLLYAGLTFGEDYLSTITAISAARNYKVKDDKGKTRNLYEAYEIKYVDPVNKTGAYLKLKDGWTKEDGSAITKEDEQKFSKRVAGMNFELQGIYNLDDRSAIQQYAFGSLIIMYRKWIAPSLQRRYGKARYSALRDQDIEGYWRTTGRFVADSIKNMREQGEGIYNSFKLNYSKLTDYEKSNITRSLTEAAILVGTCLAIALLDKLEPPKDEDKAMARYLTWADNMFLYQALRLRNELGAQAPTPLLVKEGLNILNSPFAAIRPVAATLQGLRLLDPTSYTTEVRSGRYKGHTRAYKYFWNLPILSMFKQWQNFKDPTSLINYYKNDNV